MDAPRVRLRLFFALLAPLSGCITELIVDGPHSADAAPGGGGESEEDAAAEEEVDAGPGPAPHDIDAGGQDAGPIKIPDADAPQLVGVDARVPELGKQDAAPEAGPRDAGVGSDAAIVQVLPGDGDASCKLTSCGDAGKPQGPCPGGCELSIATRPTCPSGDSEVCWSNPVGSCSFQCPDVKRCSPTMACAADEWCYFEAKDCGASGGVGYCVKQLGSCSALEAKVCGCDGKRYANGCIANQAGTAVSEVEPLCK
jgi:hypothetical protein